MGTHRLAPDSLAFALLQASRAVEAVILGRNLDVALAREADAAAWPATTRAAVQDLAYATLRDYGRGDFYLARLLARPLTPLSDPMSGFFGMDAALFRRTEPTVNPVGFKIALELFVKSRCTSSVEVGIDFGVRVAGESKLTGKVILNYIRHLIELYRFKFPLLLPLLLLVFVVFLIVIARRF